MYIYVYLHMAFPIYMYVLIYCCTCLQAPVSFAPPEFAPQKLQTQARQQEHIDAGVQGGVPSQRAAPVRYTLPPPPPPHTPPAALAVPELPGPPAAEVHSHTHTLSHTHTHTCASI